MWLEGRVVIGSVEDCKEMTGKIGWSQSIDIHNGHVKAFGIYFVGDGIFNWVHKPPN